LKFIAKALRLILKILLFFIGTVLLYLLSAYILGSITISGEAKQNQDYEIYILSNGVHTDLVVPVESEIMNWGEHISYDHTLNTDESYNYLAFGWGDRGFYLQTPTWAELKFSVAFNATFGLGTTAIHATFHKYMTENEQCKKIVVSKEQYSQMVDYIFDSFEKDEHGNIILIETDAQYGNHDAFYEAKGTYSLFFTCNSWTNKGLRVSGLNNCLWTPFDKAILRKY
jgi:uncharacterized protein (TIGR02117 family)